MKRLTCGCHHWEYYRGIFVQGQTVLCKKHREMCGRNGQYYSEVMESIRDKIPTVIYREKTGKGAVKQPHHYDHIKSDWNLDAYIKRSAA